MVFHRDSHIGQIRDGTSNTIGFAEHLAVRCGGDHYFSWILNIPKIHFTTSTPDGVFPVLRRPSFADAEAGDVIPVVRGFPPVAAPSVPGKTFQVRPSADDCDPTIAQTAHSSGMVTAFLDGSVRMLSPSISEAVYWGAVTPNSGEVLGDRW